MLFRSREDGRALTFLLIRPVWVTLVLVLLLGGAALDQRSGSRAKLTDSEAAEIERSGAEVVLRFPPETFHMNALQKVGRVVRIDGDSAFVMDVKVNQLRALAGKYWVRDVLPVGL